MYDIANKEGKKKNHTWSVHVSPLEDEAATDYGDLLSCLMH